MKDGVIARPNERERILFLGENGSGKSTLARVLLDCMPRYVIIDQKWDFPAREDDVIFQQPVSQIWKRSPDRILYRPLPNYCTGYALNAVLGKLFERGQVEGKQRPFVVYIDECLAFAKTRSTSNLVALTVTGRSLGVGVWASSQRPFSIPVELRDQAWRIYLFHLGRRSDRKEVLEYLPDDYALPDIERQTQMYSFIEIQRDPTKQGSRTVRVMAPIKPT